MQRNNDLKRLATPKALTVPPLGGIDANTVLYLDGNSLTDSSLYGKAITNNGVTVSTVQSKFGGKSLYFDTSPTTKLTTPIDSDFSMGTGSFTIDFWVCHSVASSYKNMFQIGGASGLWLQTNNNANNRMIVFLTSALITESTDAPINTWCHYALVKLSNVYALYRDGVLTGSVSNSEPINPTGSIIIGGDVSNNHSAKGYMSGFRISKGIARWTSNFTPPDRPYTILN